jgi:large subunit ribosomal protein L15
MELNSIVNSNGANRRKKRIGSGEGNGHGKTCGRGQKGSKSRSGYSVRPGFEGGQMPLYLKIPTRGFNNYRHATNYIILNVSDLKRFEGEEVVNLKLLIDKGLAPKSARRLKLLGMGDIETAINVEVDKASSSAVEKVEKAGGKVLIKSAETTESDAS